TPLEGAEANTEMFGSVLCLEVRYSFKNELVVTFIFQFTLLMTFVPPPFISGSCGKKYNRSVAHIVLLWEIQRNTVVIPKKSKLERSKENFQVFDFELYQRRHGYLIRTLDKRLRTHQPAKFWATDLYY
ncbi:Aldo/keto reductase/potassium channel subunit beta, partial [Parasponia andersonii]